MKFCPLRTTNNRFISYLHRHDIECGSYTKFFETNHVTIDITRPWLLKIGDYCKITGGVIFLTLDYSWSVFRRVYGDVVAEAKQTVIGDNVFIGMNSIILMGAEIGDNVIIGAGSVVHGKIPSNCVAAGNPARVICSLGESYRKCKELYIEEACNSARLYKEKYGDYPTIEKMGGILSDISSER